MEPTIEHGRPFLWFSGQSLDDALAFAGLSLDQPVRAIEIMGVKPGQELSSCPLHERDRARLV